MNETEETKEISSPTPRNKLFLLLKRSLNVVISPVKPLISRILAAVRRTANHVSEKTGKIVNTSLDVSLAILLLVATSLFLYMLFYWSYMPHDIQEVPIHLEFSPCPDSPSICSFPAASTRLPHPLLPGQRYSLSLLLELPDSPPNHRVGMFLSCLSLRSKAGNVVTQTCQSSMMRFRSELLRFIETILLSPYLLLQAKSQRQWITVPFHRGFIDDVHNPVVGATVTIQSRFIQVYSSRLLVGADLSGLRHVMFHHSWLSGILGVSFNLALLSSILLMSWSARDRRVAGGGTRRRRMAVEDMLVDDREDESEEELIQEKRE